MVDENYVVGVDLGGTNFRLGLVNNKGKISNYVIESSNLLIDEKNTSLDNLVNYIQQYKNKFLAGKLSGIAIGFPSTVSKDKKTVYSTPNLSGFENVNVVDYFEQRFNVPAFINKDVNYLLKWDIENLNINTKEITLGFYIGTGFGNSIYINGDFLDGKNGVAGELGHIPVPHSRDLCGCGNSGCIEVYASGKALNKIREEHFTDTEIQDIFLRYSDNKIIKDFIEFLSVPVASEINIFDPDNIIIGGGVIGMSGFPRGYFEECIKAHTRKPYPFNSLNIRYSIQNQESGVLGAALYAFEKLKEKY
jgi:allose kinase